MTRRERRARLRLRDAIQALLSAACDEFGLHSAEADVFRRLYIEGLARDWWPVTGGGI